MIDVKQAKSALVSPLFSPLFSLHLSLSPLSALTLTTALLSGCVGGGGSSSSTPSAGIEAGVKAGVEAGVEAGTPSALAPLTCADIDREMEGDQPPTGEAEEDITLSGVYRVSGRWIYDNKQRVTVEPGTVFIMESDVEFFVGWRGDAASVFMNGTEEQPILFCGAQGTPGFWRGLELLTGTREESYLEHVRIEDAGREDVAALYSDNNVRLSHVSVANNAATGLHLEGLAPGSEALSATTSLRPLVLNGQEAVNNLPLGEYTGNQEDVAELWGIENTVTTFKNIGIPYRQMNERVVLGVATGERTSFTFEPGVTYQFCQDCFLLVGWRTDPGALYVNGTEDEPVVFTSWRAEPQAGDWNGIGILSGTSSDSVINHAIIEYAGKPQEAAITINQGLISITNSHIAHSRGAGILIERDDPSLVFENNTFEDCAEGEVVGP